MFRILVPGPLIQKFNMVVKEHVLCCQIFGFVWSEFRSYCSQEGVSEYNNSMSCVQVWIQSPIRPLETPIMPKFLAISYWYLPPTLFWWRVLCFFTRKPRSFLLRHPPFPIAEKIEWLAAIMWCLTCARKVHRAAQLLLLDSSSCRQSELRAWDRPCLLLLLWWRCS